MYPNCKNDAIWIVKAVFILLPESIMMPPMRPFVYVYNLKVAVVGFIPHAYNAGVFGKAHIHS